MKYVVRYENTFQEPYYYSSNQSKQCIHTDSNEYVVDSLEMCKDVLKNFLDIPEQEMTEELVKKDFSSLNQPIDEKNVVQILDYYNGRLALHDEIIEELDMKSTTISWELKYDIPEKYNAFVVFDDGSKVKQLQSFISIKAVLD